MDSNDLRLLLLEDIDRDLVQKYNEEFKTKAGATADYFCSISWLNEYCSALPKADLFTDPAPEWRQNSVDNQYIVSLLLPIQSPLTGKIIVSICLIGVGFIE